MTAARRYEAVRDSSRRILADAVRRHGKPEGLSAAWPDGSDADRARLAGELTAEFGFPVEVVAAPEDAESEIGRQAIAAARQIRLADSRYGPGLPGPYGETMKQKRARWRKEGRCRGCGGQRDTDGPECAPCRARQRKQERRKRR